MKSWNAPSWTRSLQFRLALRISLLYLVVTAVLVAALMARTLRSADSIENHDLAGRAEVLAGALVVDASGRQQLDPAALGNSPRAIPGTDAFAIRDARGRLIAAQPAEFGERVATWANAAGDTPRYFRLDASGGGADLYGLCIRRPAAGGAVTVAIARSSGAIVLVDALLREFMVDVAWMIPVVLALTLGIGALAIRGGLRPVREASQRAAAIGPRNTSMRLPEVGLPTEVAPLVTAVNQALDRLERGFAVQREFTANAAHELRTPLAIVSAALEAMNDRPGLDAIRRDVERMNRLVEQLLRVARLDAISLDLSDEVDLQALAAEVVGSMAPWAIAQRRAIGLTPAGEGVRVRGNRHAIADALRNLVENAVIHSPEGAEVSVTVHGDARIEVADRGPGVPVENRERVFERFWRGPERIGHGAGLGLAIVREIMLRHGGRVRVAEAAAGGALFTLAFPASR